jgi:phosphoglycolate phosphatase-like HAD superfamily hydrolase
MNGHESKQVVIFDLDGTLADISARRAILEKHPKDWDRFFSGMESDLPNLPLVNLFKILSRYEQYGMVIVTGRPERYRDATTRWLNKHGLSPILMFMRGDNDRRADHLVKEEILNNIRAQGLEIQFVVDDRDTVVQMWRKNGVLCLQCDEGKF